MSDGYVLDDLKHHPRVCSNCFVLRHEADPVPIHVTERRPSVTETWTRDRTRTDVDCPPGELVSDRRPRTVCECGTFSPYASIYRDPDDPLDFDTVVDYAENIADTLDRLVAEEWDRDNLTRAARYHHNRDILMGSVMSLKSSPEYQYQDDRILAASTELACQYGLSPEEMNDREEPGRTAA